MSTGIRTGISPAQVKALAIRRYEAATGERWRDADPGRRQAWLAETEPVIRAEEGIATDAVWRDGAWQPAGQTDLFTLTDSDTEAPA